jgi:hypothetical protein
MALLIAAPRNARGPIWVTSSVAASEGKKTEEGTIISTNEPKSLSNSVAIVNPPDAQILTPPTTEEASDILTNCKI